MPLLMKTFVVGPFACNCVVIADQETRQAVVIDPGDESEQFLPFIQEHELKVVLALHTHGHLDHVSATRDLKNASGCSIRMHQGDEWLYQNLKMQGSLFGFELEDPLPIDQYLEHDEELAAGPLRFKVIHTPGHSPGSVCFELEGQDLIFTGDTLFQQSIGRTDLWGGNLEQLLGSIGQRLLPFREEVRIFPGHGPLSTIGDERRRNPFLQDL